MRKFIILALVLAVGFTLVACGGGTEEPTGDLSKYPGQVDYSKGGRFAQAEKAFRISETIYRTQFGKIIDNDKLVVNVDGKDMTKDSDYTIELAKGIITFKAPVEEKSEVKVTYLADENPAAGLLVTNNPVEGEKSLKPKEASDLVGEVRIPPYATGHVTCFDATNIYKTADPSKPDKTVSWKYSNGFDVNLEPLEVDISYYDGWTKVPQTMEMYQKGIMHKFTFDEAPAVSWWMWFELNKDVDWKKFDYFEKGIEGKLVAQYPDAKIINKGHFKNTTADAEGSWVEYTFTKDGANFKGRILHYPLRGNRVSDTEFADGQAIYAQAEGPEKEFDIAWQFGKMMYMFQEMLISTPAPQSAQ